MGKFLLGLILGIFLIPVIVYFYFSTGAAPVATVEFVPQAGGTMLIFTEQGAYLEGADGPKMREEGWGLLLGQLADELAIQ